MSTVAQHLAVTEDADRILVTCALPYVNNVPHLGNMVPILSADAYARYLRMKGIRTAYICATDEHGTRTEIEAARAELDEETYCQQLHDQMLSIFEWFHVDFTHFGRSSCSQSHARTRELFQQADANGAVLEKTIRQLYCAPDDMYLPDTYVTGTCPHCHTPGAQGDQCDACGRFLDPLELLEPRCKVCDTVPTVRETRHLFLRLDALAPRLKTWLEGHAHWQGIIRNMPLGWIEEGLEPRAITRDLKWGVRVPKAGYEDKVFYVWFDAPIGYIGATEEWVSQTPGESLDVWWKGGQARLVHFLGKDNVPFHTLMWPATLMAADAGWNLPDYVASNEYLNYEGGAFSKSRHRGVFSNQVQEMGFPADAWRYYILANRPEKRDCDFSFEAFQSTVASDLVDNLGNLINRVLSFVAKRFGVVPPLGEADAPATELLAIIEEKSASIEKAYANIELRQAVHHCLALGTEGNRYVNLSEPWRTFKSDPAACATSLHVTLKLIHRLAHLLWPIMPERSERILTALSCALNDPFTEGLTVQKPELLFQKIENEDIESLAARFRGELPDDNLPPLDFDKASEVPWPCVILELTGLDIARKNKTVRRWKQEVVDGLDLDTLESREAVRAYEALLQDGRDQGGAVSVHNLIAIVRREGKLPDINALVDVYNTWSLREGLVMGAYDRRAIQGKLLYAVADGNERFIPVRGKAAAPIHAGEWVLKDESNMVVTRIGSKQSEAAAITPSTTSCVVCIQGNPHTPLALLEAVAEGMAADIQTHCGGELRVVHAG